MYVMRSGTVEIERDGKIVETVTAGGIFGEMALIDGVAASRDGACQDGLRGRSHYRKELPVPGA